MAAVEREKKNTDYRREEKMENYIEANTLSGEESQRLSMLANEGSLIGVSH